jgi:hypothetical protein
MKLLYEVILFSVVCSGATHVLLRIFGYFRSLLFIQNERAVFTPLRNSRLN